MAVDLIGAYQSWDKRILSPAQVSQFARALDATGPRSAKTYHVGDTLCGAADEGRRWQPYIAPDGSHVLFAGFIDNRRQLAFELGISPRSDGNLYAAGLAVWGDAIDIRAAGEFATITVRPNDKPVRLSRSPIGAPPLHYWHDRERFIVASIVNAIFATGEVEQRIDHQKIADTLFLNYNEGVRSWFEGVCRLPCGHRAIATPDGVVTEQYYDLSKLPKIRLKDDRHYEETATELLQQAVDAALDGFSRPAICLSGGFNSQAVAAFMVRSRPAQSIEAFTSVPEAGWDGAVHPDRFGNERPHVEALAAEYSEIRPHWIDAAGLSFDHNLSSMFLLAGAPPRNAMNLHWIHEAYAKARSTGCDVMLNGNFGNVTFSFSGDGALPSMARRGQWARLWREAGYLSWSLARTRLHVLATHALLPLVPDWFHAGLKRLGVVKVNDPFERWCPLAPTYAKVMKVKPRARTFGFDPNFRRYASTSEWRIAALTLMSQDSADIYQAFDLLHGMETRDPTRHRPLVEFCLGIPDDQYLRNGQSRWLARRMLAGLVPDMVLSETRIGQQSADWHLRLGRQRHELIAEIEQLQGNDHVAEMLNLGPLREALIDWPQSSDGPSAARLSLALPRALATARFVRFVEGSNS